MRVEDHCQPNLNRSFTNPITVVASSLFSLGLHLEDLLFAVALILLIFSPTFRIVVSIPPYLPS